jgi:hypothetical protein
LPCRNWRAAHDRSDFLERHSEHIVQDECEPLMRSQGFQYDKKGQPDGISDQGFLFGINPVFAAENKVRETLVKGLLSSRPART